MGLDRLSEGLRLQDTWQLTPTGQKARSSPWMGKKRLIRTFFAQLITKSYPMIHGKLNVFKKLQSLGPRKAGIAANWGTHFRAITVVTHISEAQDLLE